MYNKSEIMKRAAVIRKQGTGKSEALKIAWIETKIEAIDNKLFALDMIDRQSTTERDTVRRFSNERRVLNEKINPAPAKLEDSALTNAEKAQINDELCKIMMSYRPDWNRYRELESKLYTAA